jgi:hypothetical protein
MPRSELIIPPAEPEAFRRTAPQRGLTTAVATRCPPVSPTASDLVPLRGTLRTLTGFWVPPLRGRIFLRA